MKIPVCPPDLPTILETVMADPGRLARWKLLYGGSVGPTPDGKYLHWDILRHLPPT